MIKYLQKSAALLSILVLFSLINQQATAQTTYTWANVMGGDFQTQTNWMPWRTTPAANDVLVFSSLVDITITNVPTQAIGRLRNTSSGTITLQPTAGSNRTLTIQTGGTSPQLQTSSTGGFIVDGVSASNNLTIEIADGNAVSLGSGSFTVNNFCSFINRSGDFTITTGGFTFRTGSRAIIVRATGGVAPKATWETGSLLSITGTTGQPSPYNLNQSFADLTWNNTSSTGVVLLRNNGENMTVTGTLTIASAGTNSSIVANTNTNNILINNLVLNAGTMQLNRDAGGTANVTVSGNISITGGTLSVGTSTGSIVLSGNNTTLTNAGSISGALPFLINKNAVSNTVSLNSNVVLPNALSFLRGSISTGSNLLTVSGNITGASSSSGWIIGNLVRPISVGTTTTVYPVGDASNYLPVTITFTGVSTGGNILVNTQSGDHPQIASSCLISALSVNRYWVITNSGTSLSPVNMQVLTNFLPGELDGGVVPNQFMAGIYNGSSWSYASRTNATTSLYQSNSFGTLGHLQIAHPNTVSSLGAISGITNICTSSPTSIYTVPTATFATSYNWSVPSGFIVSAGQGTTSATVSVSGAAGLGVLSVTATNTCTTTPMATYNVTVTSVPSSPSSPSLSYLFSNNYTDGSGNANTGLPQNSPVFTVDRNGISNGALALNGSTQYVTNTNLTTGISNFSLSIWIKTSSNTGGWIMGREANQTTLGSNDRKIFMNDNGIVKFGVFNGGITTIASSAALNDNLWHHIVASHSVTTGISLYIDGVLNASSAVISADGNTGYWRVGYGSNWGGANGSTNGYFTGSVDDAQVFTRALTSTEVPFLTGVTYTTPLICSGLYLSAPTISGANYSWTGPLGFTSTQAYPTLTGVTAANSGTYTWNSTINGCAIQSLTGAITISGTTNLRPTIQYLFSGNANDDSGSGNTGLPQNAPTYVTGRYGNATSALTVNGTNQYVTNTNISTGISNFSLSIWIKTNTNTGGWIFGREANQTTLGSNDRKIFMNDNGFVRFGVYNGGINTIVSNTALNDNQWHHLVATHSATTGISLYVDGVLHSSSSSVSTDGNTGYWRIAYGSNWAGANGSTSDYFSGAVDDAQVFTRTLTATEVALLYGVVANSPACTSLSLSVISISGANYVWSGPGGFTSTIRNPTINNVTTINSGIYSVSVSVPGCIYNAQSASIVTDSYAVFTSTIIGANTVCQQQTSAVYSVTGISNGTNYVWSVPSGFTIVSGQGTAQVTLSVSGIAVSGNLSLTGINTFCGAGPPITKSITVNNVLLSTTTGITYNTPPVCNTLFLYAPTVSGASYAWSGPNGFSSVLTNPTISGVTTVNSGLYSLSISSGICTSPVLTNNITTTGSPGTIGGIAGSATTLCNYQSGVVYTIGGIANVTSYNWTVPSGMTITNGQGSNAVTVSVSGIYAGGNISVSGSNVCGISLTTTIGISVNGFTSSLYNGIALRYSFDGNTNDLSGNSNNGVSVGSPGYTTDRNGNVNGAINLNGSTQYVYGSSLVNTPPVNYSFSMWFNTSANTGGKLIGFGNTTAVPSATYDRHIYMSNAGNLVLGNYNGANTSTITPLTYNDGIWHHLAGTYSAANGLRIYVDGILVSSTVATGTFNYAGYWKIGADNITTWPSAPTSNYFNGALDELYIYNREISGNEVLLLAGITDNSPVCSGNSLSLASGTFSGANYIWSGPGYSSTAINPTITGVTSTNTGNYALTISVSGCSISNSKIITIDQSISNTISGVQTICSGAIPLNNLNGGITPTQSYSYVWESSTTSSTTGFSIAAGTNTTSGYTFPAALTQTTWYRRHAIFNNCTTTSAPLQITVITPNVAQNLIYPTGIWNMYAFWSQNTVTNSTNTWTNYGGFSTINGLNFDSRTLPTVTGFATTAGSTTGYPSNALNFNGCQINNINYSLSYKSQSMVSVTGIYKVDLPYYDDATSFYLNGNQYFYDPNWYNNVPKYAIYVGPINPTDALEFRLNQGGGAAGIAATFTLTTPGVLTGGVISTSQSVCVGNTPDPFINVSLPGNGCNVASYKWQSSVSGGNWTDLASSNSVGYTYGLSITQPTNFRRVATDVCSQVAYSNIVTVDNNITPPGNPTLAGIGSWNAYFYYDRNFGSYAGYMTIAGQTFNTNPTVFASGTAPSLNANYVGCNINATNISARFLQTGFTPSIYQIDIPSHDDDVYVLVNGVQVFVHNGCCDAHTNVYKGLLGASDVVEVRWQQGGGASELAITMTTVVSPVIVAGSIGQNSLVCYGELPTQPFQTVTSTTGCTISSYQWQSSTLSGVSGYVNIANATTAGFNPNFNIYTNTWLRRIDYDACGQSATLAGVVLSITGTVPGDTSVYPVNYWNTYGFNASSYWNNYSGYATILGQSFRTDVNGLFTSNAQSPSYIYGYQGCSILPSTFSSRTKRMGFTPARYDIAVSHDDSGELWVNGVQVYSAGCCANPTGTIWSGDLGASDRLEFRQIQAPGAAYYGVMLSTTTIPSGVTSGGVIIGNQTICSGTMPTVNATNSITGIGGGCYIYYAWESSTVAGFGSAVNTIVGLSTSTSLNTTLLGSLTQTVYVRRAAIDACGTKLYSNTITISVTSPINAGSINSVAGVCAGSSPAAINQLTPATGGLGAYSYIWQFSTDNISYNTISSATGINYTSPIAISVPTYFRRNVFGGGCSTATGIAILVPLNTNAAITAQPLNTTVCGGSLATFTIGTSGVISGYQWQISTSAGVYLNISNNQIINSNTFTGVVANTLSISGVNNSLAGAIFRNILTSGCGGTITSTGAVLTIGGPGVVTQPANAVVCTGLPAVFAPVLSGTAISYQWQMSTNAGANYSNIVNNGTFSGANTASLTVSGATTTAAMTGIRFLLNVTSSCNSFSTSTTVGILTVTGLIAGNTISIPSSTICSGVVTTITGSSPSGGGGTYSYQWQSSVVNSTSGFNNITTNGIAMNYTTPGIVASVWYRRIINTNSGCQDLSTAVGISPMLNTSIVGSSGNLSQCPGTNAIFTVTAVGSGSITYQWQENQGAGWNNLLTNATYTGVSTSLLSIVGISTSMTTWQYRCLVNSSCGSQQTSTSRTLTILTPVAITGNPSGYATCANATTMVMNVTATGSATITYQWQFSTNSGGGYGPIGAVAPYNWASINTNQLSLASGIPASYNGYWYRASVTNSCGTVYSNPAILTVNPVLATNSISPDQSICPGIPSSIAGTNPTGGNGSYIYNWQSSVDNATWNNVNPTVTSVNFIPTSSLSGTTYFRRQVSSQDCPVNNSNSTTITVTPGTAIVTQPVATATCVNTNASFSVAATGSTLSYQWQYATTTASGGNWANVSPVTLGVVHSGSQSTGLTIQSVPNSFNSYFYRCLVNGNCTPVQVTSTGVMLTVNPLPPLATSITGVATVCQGQTNVSYLTTTLTNTVSYVWTLPTGASISSGTGTNMIAVNYSNSALSGNVFVAGVNGCGTGTGSSLSVTVNPLPGATGAISGSNSVCQGAANLSYSVSPITNTVNYNWILPSGFNLISGTNTNAITISFASTATSGIISLSGNNACGTGTGNALSVTVNTTPGTAGSITGMAVVCQGNTGVLYSVVGISGASSYTWTLPSGASIASGSGTNSIGVNYSAGAASGIITVRGINGSCLGSISPLFNLTVNPSLTNNTISASISICAGTDPGTLTGTNPVGGNNTYTYVWLRSTVNSISGFTTAPGMNTGRDYGTGPVSVNTWYRRVVSSGVCTNITSAGIGINISTIAGWLGNTSDWQNAINWCGNSVPGISSDISIAAGVAYMPIITGTGASARNITISSSASLQMQTGVLSITGNLINTGTFIAATSTGVALCGTGNQTISGSHTFYDLSISNKLSTINGVSLGSNQNLLGTLTLGNNAKFVTTGYTFTLVSNSITGTARIAQVPASSVIVGNINVQRFIPAKLAYRYLGSPVRNATFTQWQNNMIITGNGSGSDYPTVALPVLYQYFEPVAGDQSRGFNKINTISGTILPGVGYRALVMGDRTVNPSATTFTPTNTTLEVSGVPNVGDINIPLSYTSNTNLTSDGWNLVANPYPSQIDWDQVIGLGSGFQRIDNAIYILDPDPTSTMSGTYFSYVNGVSQGRRSTRANPSLIPSSQGFFIHANAANPILTLRESVKSSTTGFTDNFRQANIQDLLYISIENAKGYDNTAIRFAPDAGSSFDPAYDAYKFKNSGLNISTHGSTDELSVNTMAPLTNKKISVPVSIANNAKGTYALTFDNQSSFASHISMYLEDRLQNTMTRIEESHRYSFDITNATVAGSRFMIHFIPEFGTVKTIVSPDSVSQAAWTLDHDTVWHPSGEVISDVSAGNHIVKYKPVQSWSSPSSVSINVVAGDTTFVAGVYTPVIKKGSLHVQLTQSGISSGRVKAQWKINNGEWITSGTTISNLIPGTYHLNFSQLTGYESIQPMDVVVADQQTTFISLSYQLQTSATVDSTFTSIDKTSTETLIVYPNPLQENQDLMLQQTIGDDAEITIHNAVGVQLYQEKCAMLKTKKLSVFKNYPSGIYELQIATHSKRYHFKILKE